MSIHISFNLHTYQEKALPKILTQSGFQRINVDVCWFIRGDELFVFFHELELSDAIISNLEKKHPEIAFKIHCMIQGVTYKPGPA